MDESSGVGGKGIGVWTILSGSPNAATFEEFADNVNDDGIAVDEPHCGTASGGSWEARSATAPDAWLNIYDFE